MCSYDTRVTLEFTKEAYYGTKMLQTYVSIFPQDVPFMVVYGTAQTGFYTTHREHRRKSV